MTRSTPEFLQSLWRERLGEMPEAAKLRQLDSLNDIPDAVIAVARRLSPRRRMMSLISAYMREDPGDMWLSWFVQDVVEGEIVAADGGETCSLFRQVLLQTK